MRLASLDTFLAWQDDEGDRVDCCLLNPPLDGEEEDRDCESCRYREVSSDLRPADLRALESYRYLSLPVVKDLRLTDATGHILGLRMTRTEATDWLERVNLIHRYRAPTSRPEPSREAPDE